MKKALLFLLVFLLAGSITNIFCQDQYRSVNINTLHIVTDRSLVMNGFGGFSMSGTDENGDEFYRQATRGVFNAPFVDCIPCRKGAAFTGTFYTDNWLTGETTQGLSEWANLGGLVITASDWSIPVQFPYGRPIVKYIPVTITGAIRVTDSRQMPIRTIYTDQNVNMNGTMKVEFTKSVFNMMIQWRNVEITASEN